MKSDLSDSDFNALCALFPDPKKEGHVRWKDFVNAMEPGKSPLHYEIVYVISNDFKSVPCMCHGNVVVGVMMSGKHFSIVILHYIVFVQIWE